MSNYRVRRATVDDLPGLQPLWRSMHFPVTEFEKRLTDFHLAETESGELLGTLGIEIQGHHGRLYGEAFFDFALAESLREQLWQRIQTLAANRRIFRLWTCEIAPFWSHNGFSLADSGVLTKLPATWSALPGKWLTLMLQDEELVEAALTREFERFKAENREASEAALARAKTLKFIATGLAIVASIAAILFCLYLLRNFSHIRRY